MSFLAVTLGQAMSLEQRLAVRRAVVRAAIRSPPHSDGKSLARRHAFRLAAPSGDLAVFATLIARHMGHAAIVRRSAGDVDFPAGRWTSVLEAPNDPVAGGPAPHPVQYPDQMSWDILIIDLPREAQTVSDLPDDFEPRPLGSRNDLITAILSAAPTADFSDPSWGQILAKDFSIEVNLGTDEQVGSVMLHVRGDDGAIALIAEILDRLNTRALDIQTGQVFEETAAATSIAAWRSYRDRIISQQGQASR